MDIEDREKEQAERSAKMQAALDNDFKKIMGMREGRRFIWHQIARCGVFNSMLHEDPHMMYFREGKRDNGLELLARIQALCPELYTIMANENATNQIED